MVEAPLPMVMEAVVEVPLLTEMDSGEHEAASAASGGGATADGDCASVASMESSKCLSNQTSLKSIPRTPGLC